MMDLDVGHYPPFLAKQILAGHDWRQIDRIAFRNDWTVLVELHPRWFVYYTPLVFLSACEESELPQTFYACQESLRLFLPSSMFSGAFSSEDVPILSDDQIGCLLGIVKNLHDSGYLQPLESDGELFANQLLKFINGSA